MAYLKNNSVKDVKHKREWDHIMETKETFLEQPKEKGSNCGFLMRQAILKSPI